VIAVVVAIVLRGRQRELATCSVVSSCSNTRKKTKKFVFVVIAEGELRRSKELIRVGSE
jgi:hypothetical protein